MKCLPWLALLACACGGSTDFEFVGAGSGGSATSSGNTTSAGGVSDSSSSADVSSASSSDASSSASTGQGGASTTAVTASSSSGNMNCITCSEWLSNMGGNVCGSTPQGCLPNTSCEILAKLGECVCGGVIDPGSEGKCKKDCPATCGVDPNANEPGCQTCVFSQCGGEAQACFND